MAASGTRRFLEHIIRQRDQFRTAMDADQDLYEHPAETAGRIVSQVDQLKATLYPSNTDGETLETYRASLAEAAKGGLASVVCPIITKLWKTHGELIEHCATGGRTRCPLEKHLRQTAELIDFLPALEQAASREPNAPRVRKKNGRRGYPAEVLNFAKKLKKDHRDMKVVAIRNTCLAHFKDPDLMPATVDAFRTWMNRKRKRTRTR